LFAKFYIFATVQKIKKYIAGFLLLVFSLAALPPSVLHNAFANHTDTADNYCDFYHKDLGTHVESEHTSCDIFKANTPVYDVLTVSYSVSVFRFVISQYKIAEISSVSHKVKISLPARAPPIA
jgi:hypothetical protein